MASSMAESITREFPTLNDAQRDAIAHTGGPTLVIAGPGSGKTEIMVLRALNAPASEAVGLVHFRYREPSLVVDQELLATEG